MTHADFTPAEHANFAAARAVAYATAFLDGRTNAETLHFNARSTLCELMVIGEDIRAKGILDVTRLLIIASLNASAVREPARLDRWQHVMGALVDLAKLESKNLRETGAQRS